MRSFLKEESNMKSNRHKKILELIEENDIYTQEELLNLLCSNGYNVTQATISRDIKDLKLIKIQSSNGKYKYANSTSLNKEENLSYLASYLAMFKDSIISIQPALNIVVIKCIPGMAQAVCVAIDSLNLNYVIGTIAGDDTIFIASSSEKEAISLINVLNSLLK